jgi:hypothetical protein
MPIHISSDKIQALVQEVETSFPHGDCYTCECYLGYLTRLEMDAGKELRSWFTQFKPDKTLTHSCLGCDPCPPADAFANYLRTKSLIDPREILG